MKQEVVKKETTAPAVFNTDFGFGAAEGLGLSDLKIDRILMMQALSKLVKKEEAKNGAMVAVSSKKEFAYKKEKKMEFIAIKTLKYWIEQDKETKKYIGRKPGQSPEDYPWEEMVNGKMIKRTFTQSYLVLIPSEIAEGEDLPYELAFRSTTLECARSINVKFFNMQRKGLPSYAKVLGITTEMKEKGDHSWYVPVDEIVRDVTAAEAKACEEWIKQLKTTKYDLAEEDDSTEEASSSSNGY